MTDTFVVRLERLDGYRFRASFEGSSVPDIILDEPAPLGAGTGPNPARLLAASVGDCLSASLVFCLSKSRTTITSVNTAVLCTYRRNEKGRLRIGRLDVSIVLDTPESDSKRLASCLATFEDFCVVTGSVRRGIDVSVTIDDASGNRLYPATTV
jgi:uncharacterized OsmC-like protein